MKLSLVLYVIVIALAFLQVSFAQGDGGVIDEDGETDSGDNPADDSLCPNNKKVFESCKRGQEATLNDCPVSAWQCKCYAYRDLQNCYRGCEPSQDGIIDNLEAPRQDACRRAAEEAEKSSESEDEDETSPEEEKPTETDDSDEADSQNASASDDSSEESPPPNDKSSAIKIHPTVFSALLVVMAAALF